MGSLKMWALKYTFQFLSPRHAWKSHLADRSLSGDLIDRHQEAVLRIKADEALRSSSLGAQWKELLAFLFLRYYLQQLK